MTHTCLPIDSPFDHSTYVYPWLQTQVVNRADLLNPKGRGYTSTLPSFESSKVSPSDWNVKTPSLIAIDVPSKPPSVGKVNIGQSNSINGVKGSSSFVAVSSSSSSSHTSLIVWHLMDSKDASMFGNNRTGASKCA